MHLRRWQADGLPFSDESFDIVLSSHFLDLLATEDIIVVVGLKPAGRLVLANISKERERGLTLSERLYTLLPTCCTAYLLGACRPVFASEFLKTWGFVNIRREFFSRYIRSEVVTAENPPDSGH